MVATHSSTQDVASCVWMTGFESFQPRSRARSVLHMPSAGVLSSKLKFYLRKAGFDRGDLFVPAMDRTRKALCLYDLRATGITWMAARGDDLATHHAARWARGLRDDEDVTGARGRVAEVVSTVGIEAAHGLLRDVRDPTDPERRSAAAALDALLGKP